VLIFLACCCTAFAQEVDVWSEVIVTGKKLKKIKARAVKSRFIKSKSVYSVKGIPQEMNTYSEIGVKKSFAGENGLVSDLRKPFEDQRNSSKKSSMEMKVGDGNELRFKGKGLSFGLYKNTETQEFKGPGGSLFNSNDDQILERKRDKEHHYIDYKKRIKKIEIFTSYDYASSFSFSGPVKNGRKRANALEMAISSKLKDHSLGVSFLGQDEKFSSKSALFDHSRTKATKYSFLYGTPIFYNFNFQVFFERENLNRVKSSFFDENESRDNSYRRDRIEFRAGYENKWKDFTTGFSAIQAINADQFVVEDHERRSSRELNLSGDIEWLPWYFGISVKGKILRNPPSVQMFFGDGANLGANQNLLNEKGQKWSIGPIFKSKHVQLSAHLVHEYVEQKIEYVAVSPVQAKAQNIGGLWSLGQIYSLDIAYEKWKLQGHYKRVDARNSSEIAWARGNPYPGVPKHNWYFDFGPEFQHFSAKIGHEYLSAKPLTLNAKLYEDEEHISFAQIKVYDRDMYIGLKGENLFYDRRKALVFEGAGGHLKDPELRQTKYILFAGKSF
jgi:hypothetical protein